MNRHRRYLLIASFPLLLLGLLFLGLWIKSILDREAQFRDSERLLNEAVAELDAADPGWRWADRVARKSDLPDEENLFVQAQRVKALLDRKFERDPFPSTSSNFLFENVQIEPNQLHDSDNLAALGRHQAYFAPAVAVAAKIEHLKRSFAATPTDQNPYLMPLPEHWEITQSVRLLKYEVEWLALNNRPDEAIPLLRTMLVLAGSSAEDGLLIGNLIRGGWLTIVAHRIERLLGLTEPGDNLRTLLEPLRRVAQGRDFYLAMRGERAYYDGIFCYLENHPDGLNKMIDEMNEGDQLPGRKQYTPDAALRYYEPLMKAEHASGIRWWTAILNACNLPLHEREAAISKIIAEWPWPEFDLTLTRLMGLRDTNSRKPSQIARIIYAEQRAVAKIETVRALIACELFRQTNKRWPKSLQEIPRDLLPEVPLDPYDGKPHRYRLLPDGVAVWSIGDSGIEDPLNRKDDEEKPPVNMVFRLWNPELRRLPAPPPKPELLHTPDELPDEERKE